MDWGQVYPHRGLRSFDFGGSFALLIAILGYVQLVVVLTSFIAVSQKMNRYEKRLGRLGRGRTLTLQNGRLQAMVISGTRQKQIENTEENCTVKNGSRSDEVRTSPRGITTLICKRKNKVTTPEALTSREQAHT